MGKRRGGAGACALDWALNEVTSAASTRREGEGRGGTNESNAKGVLYMTVRVVMHAATVVVNIVFVGSVRL